MRVRELKESEKTVVHETVGRFIERMSLVRRRFGHSHSYKAIHSSPVLTAELNKGVKSEKKFKDFVEDLIEHGQLPWADKIIKASRIQDEREKIDYFIRAHMEGLENNTTLLVPIQVKSSWGYAEEFKQHNPNAQVHIVVMGKWIEKPKKLVDVLNRFYLKEVEALMAPS
jgi:hypothetical protein